jgi:hypothetical protein
MDNPEKTEGATENGQSRENRRGNQEWTIQRKPKGQPRLDNPESNWQHGVHKTQYEDKQNKNTPQKAKNMSNTDSTNLFFFSALCDITCHNGGKCIRHNKCKCKRGYTGKDCTKRMYFLYVLIIYF